MNRFLSLIAVFLVIGIIFSSCQKEIGNNYLRVFIALEGSYENIILIDENDTILIDSQYHLVGTQLDLSYILPGRMFDSVINYTSELYPSPAVNCTNVSVFRYFGELQKDESDRYYTLVLKYKNYYNEPKRSYFSINGKYWYSIYIQYYDCSELSFSYNP